LKRIGNFDIIDALESALKVSPSDSDNYFEIAKLYKCTGSPAKAFDAYQNGFVWFTEEFENDEVNTARKYISEYKNRPATQMKQEGACMTAKGDNAADFEAARTVK
jgi:hypothetical protein